MPFSIYRSLERSNASSDHKLRLLMAPSLTDTQQSQLHRLNSGTPPNRSAT
jgi:hypothetical protein